jgi:hypothetical protein
VQGCLGATISYPYGRGVEPRHLTKEWAPEDGGASGATGYHIAKRWSVLADNEQERHERGEQESALPPSYYLDESDPDILILRRPDDTFVAAFSAQGATREGIVEAAKEDYYKSLLERSPEDDGDDG